MAQTSSTLHPFQSKNAAGNRVQCLMYGFIFGSTHEKYPVTPPLYLGIAARQMLSPSEVAYLITPCTDFLIVGAFVPSSFSLRRVNFLKK